MINTKDQEQMFKLVADYIEKDIICIAIGGTAMMFKGYKNSTKDIDLVFSKEEDRNLFIKAIRELGYKEQAIGKVYDEKRKQNSGKPLMFTRGEERFDLFVKNVFGYELKFSNENIKQRNDFLGKNELTVNLPMTEELILLKSITGREKDFEDIETIMEIEKNVNWNLIVEKAVQQKKNNEWILIDLEETLQKLKEKYFIKKDIFERIYKS